MAGSEVRARDAEVVWRACWRRRVNTALVLGGLGFVYVTAFLLSSGLFELTASRREQVALGGAALVFLSVEYPFAVRRSRRFFAPVADWLNEGGTPSDVAFERLHGLPYHHAKGIATEWLFCMITGITIHALSQPMNHAQLAFFSVGGLSFGLHLGWMVFLLVEAGLASEFAAAAQARPDRPHPANRLLVHLSRTVVVAGGIAFFWAIMVLAFPANRREADLNRAVGPLTVFVLVVGVGMLIWSIRSVSATVTGLRDGLRHVESGDLSIQVPVTDRTELGSLQQSFNHMVVRLRDRDLLERLLQRHVGSAVAEASRQHGSRILGEEREVSVLFVDLIGSTQMTRQLAPEVMVDLLNAYFDVIVGRVAAHGGEVLQFQGDGAICLFGAPNALDHHEEHALAAARGLRADLLAFASDHPGVLAAIAVSTGPVVVGHLGSDERHTYTAIGDAVNEASRLLRVAKGVPTLTLASEATVLASGDEAARWDRAGQVLLRGRDVTTTYCCPVAEAVSPGRPVGRSAADDTGAVRDTG